MTTELTATGRMAKTALQATLETIHGLAGRSWMEARVTFGAEKIPTSTQQMARVAF